MKITSDTILQIQKDIKQIKTALAIILNHFQIEINGQVPSTQQQRDMQKYIKFLDDMKGKMTE